MLRASQAPNPVLSQALGMKQPQVQHRQPSWSSALSCLGDTVGKPLATRRGKDCVVLTLSSALYIHINLFS